MAGDWDLVGGDPAPGHLGDVEASVQLLRLLHARLAESMAGLGKVTGLVESSDGSKWEGDAAKIFGEGAKKLHAEVTNAEESFSLALKALESYSRILGEQQPEALRARTTAHEADEERQQAAKDAASAAASGRNALWNLGSLRVREKALEAASLIPEADPSTAMQLDQTRRSIRRSEGQLAEHRETEQRHRNLERDAKERLDSARRRVNEIRDIMNRAASVLEEELKQAERKANLPSWVQKQNERTIKEFKTIILPSLVEAFDLGQQLFSTAALLTCWFPPASGIFALGATLSGGVSFISQGLLAMEDGLDEEERWDLAKRGLTTMAGCCTAGFAPRVGMAISLVGDGVAVADAYRTGGPDAAAAAATSRLVTKGAAMATGAVLGSAKGRGAIKGIVNKLSGKHPNLSSALSKGMHSVTAEQHKLLRLGADGKPLKGLGTLDKVSGAVHRYMGSGYGLFGGLQGAKPGTFIGGAPQLHAPSGVAMQTALAQFGGDATELILDVMVPTAVNTVGAGYDAVSGALKNVKGLTSP